MKHNASNRRSRGRNNRNNNRGNQNPRSQVHDSNGPDVRIRGTANQICEKYLALAKDARSSGDMVMAESYLQHAEHYQRIINSYEPAQPKTPPVEADSTIEEDNQSEEPKANKAANTDLDLPASILGEAVVTDIAEEKSLETA